MTYRIKHLKALRTYFPKLSLTSFFPKIEEDMNFQKTIVIKPSKRRVKSCSVGRASRFSSFQFICHFPRAKNPHAKADSSLTNRNNASLILANFLGAIISHLKSFMILFEQNSFILIHY